MMIAARAPRLEVGRRRAALQRRGQGLAGRAAIHDRRRRPYALSRGSGARRARNASTRLRDRDDDAAADRDDAGCRELDCHKSRGTDSASAPRGGDLQHAHPAYALARTSARLKTSPPYS